MSTRLEAIFAEVVTEMGVDPSNVAFANYSYWGKRADEARKALPWITWVEEDQGEKIVAPLQDESAHEPICAMREVPVLVTIGAADSNTSEDIHHSLLAAVERAFSSRAYAWGDVEKAGGRPNSGPHLRAQVFIFRIPVLVEERMLHTITSTSMSVEATDQAGLSPEQGVP